MRLLQIIREVYVCSPRLLERSKKMSLLVSYMTLAAFTGASDSARGQKRVARRYDGSNSNC